MVKKKSIQPAAEVESTEAKIHEAARKVFMQKGYAATRTRDIAAEAGINLALLNYYFRSKEKLFEVIILETMQQFLSGLKAILNRKDLSLEEKTDQMVEHYFSMLLRQPDMPLFLLGELRQNPSFFKGKMDLRAVIFSSHFYKQLKAVIPPGANPFQYVTNLISLIVFPFAAMPMLQHMSEMSPQQFSRFQRQRKQQISGWFHAILHTKTYKA